MGGMWVVAVVGATLLLLGFLFLLLAGGASALKNPALRRPKPTIKVPVEREETRPLILTIKTDTTAGGDSCPCQYCAEARRLRGAKGK